MRSGAFVARMSAVKPALEVVALVLAAGWFLGQCGLGDHTPAVELAIDVIERVPAKSKPNTDLAYVRASYKGVRGMVLVEHAVVEVWHQGVRWAASCPRFFADPEKPKGFAVPAGDVLTSVCALEVPSQECAVIRAAVVGRRAFSLFRVWVPPRWLGLAGSRWRAASATCPATG